MPTYYRWRKNNNLPKSLCRENGIQVLFNPTMPEINGLHTNISVQSLRGEVGEVEQSFLAGVVIAGVEGVRRELELGVRDYQGEVSFRI